MPGDGWTTVGKKVNKQKSKPRSAEEVSELVATSESAFASLDKDWKKSKDARGENGVSHASGHSGVSGVNGIASNNSHNGKRDMPSGKQLATSKAKKPKAPKVKKPTPAAAGADLDVAKLRQIISQVEDRYAANERVQLDTVADHFVTTFREADLPFNKMLSDQSLEKVTHVPANAVSDEIASVMHAFVAGKDAQAVADFASSLIDSAFEGVPSAAGSSKSPPKANVGLLVVLALALRAKPAALLVAADHLTAGRSRYSSSGRLPMLLWLINQAAQGSKATAVAVWVRVLLPQIIGVASLVPASRAAPASKPSAATAGPQGSIAAPMDASQLSAAATEKAFTYLQELLRAPNLLKSSISSGVTAGNDVIVPLVPPSAIIAVAQAVGGLGSELAPEVTAALSSHQRILRTIAFSGSPKAFDRGELLRLAIDAAGACPAVQPDDPFIADVAQLVATALAGDDAAFATWQSKHKSGLRGSSRILGALDRNHPQTTMPLMADPEKRAAFVELMIALRGRHQYALRSSKGWQGPAARTANAASLALEAKVKRDGRKTASRSALLALAGGLAASLALGLLTDGTAGVVRHPFLQTISKIAEVTGVAAALSLAAAVAEPYRQQAAPYVQPVVDAAKPVLQQAQSLVAPLMRQASQAVQEASVSTAWAIRNLTSFSGSS